MPDCVQTPAEELAVCPATTRLPRNAAASSRGRRCLHAPPAPQPSAARQSRHWLSRNAIELCHGGNSRPRASMAYAYAHSGPGWPPPLAAAGRQQPRPLDQGQPSPEGVGQDGPAALRPHLLQASYEARARIPPPLHRPTRVLHPRLALLHHLRPAAPALLHGLHQVRIPPPGAPLTRGDFLKIR